MIIFYKYLDRIKKKRSPQLSTLNIPQSRTMIRFILVLVAVITLVNSTNAIKEPKTGLDFPAKYDGSKLSKWGVRTKGPIKVYSVGQYGDTFLLKMNMKVGAEKMASAMTDALKPRCKDAESIEEFKTAMLNGLPKGCSKGSSLAFACKGGKLSMSANNKKIGCVKNKNLAKAFIGIYTDRKAVCKLIDVEED